MDSDKAKRVLAVGKFFKEQAGIGYAPTREEFRIAAKVATFSLFKTMDLLLNGDDDNEEYIGTLFEAAEFFIVMYEGAPDCDGDSEGKSGHA